MLTTFDELIQLQFQGKIYNYDYKQHGTMYFYIKKKTKYTYTTFSKKRYSISHRVSLFLSFYFNNFRESSKKIFSKPRHLTLHLLKNKYFLIHQVLLKYFEKEKIEDQEYERGCLDRLLSKHRYVIFPKNQFTDS